MAFQYLGEDVGLPSLYESAKGATIAEHNFKEDEDGCQDGSDGETLLEN